MARMTLNATVGTAPTPGYSTAKEPNAELAAQAVNIAAVATAASAADTEMSIVVGADQTAVEAAVATLEADGAAPTQAHVNALRTQWNTMKIDTATTKGLTAAAVTAAGVPSLTAAIAAVSSDVTLLVNGANVVTKNKLKQIVDSFYNMVANGSSLLT